MVMNNMKPRCLSKLVFKKSIYERGARLRSFFVTYRLVLSSGIRAYTAYYMRCR